MEMWRPATSLLELQMKASFQFDMSIGRFFHQLEEEPWRQYQLGSAGCDFTTYGLRSDELLEGTQSLIRKPMSPIYS